MNLKALLAALCSLVLATAAHAQWQSTTYSLKGGWNAIYLHGDATHATPDELFANEPEVLELWRWNPNPNQQQFSATSLVPNTGTPEWSVWRRGDPLQSNLVQLFGQTGYLVKCSGTSGNTHSVPILQKPRPPSSTWVRSGANLMGFPTRLNVNYPLFSNYFATFPAAIASNAKIYKYIGGELGSGQQVGQGPPGQDNPQQIFSPSTERLDRNQAYWFEAEVVNRFYAPVEVSLSHEDGLTFGRTGSVVTLRVRNRTSSGMTLTLTPVSSLPAPTGQEGITGQVTLRRRVFDEQTGEWEEMDIFGSYTEFIPAQSTVTLDFGINRAAMMGPAGSFYASVLRLTDSGNLFQIDLPATAKKASLAGLWVGEANITSVSSQVASGAAGRAGVVNGQVTGIEVMSRGIGYKTPPTITIDPPVPYQQAEAAATVSANGQISLLSVTTPGTGYVTAPIVTIAPPAAGVQAAGVSHLLADGGLSHIVMTNVGSGYFGDASLHTLTLAAPPVGVQATASASAVGGVVTSASVSAGGSGYLSPPTVTLSAPTGTAQATAVLTDGVVTGITLVNAGQNYTSAPTVTVASPSTQAEAESTLDDGAVSAITVTEPGTNYEEAPTVTISAPGTQAAAVAVLDQGTETVTSLTLVSGGSGYGSEPEITIAAPPGGIAAQAIAIMTDDVITGFEIIQPGSGYTTAPVVTIPAPGVQATATAEIDAFGHVTGITVVTAGSGYITEPAVTLSAPPGDTATVEAIYDNGVITGFTVISGGSGYNSVPVVTVGSPVTQTTATAVATLTGDVVTGITITSGGSGYSTAPTVTLSSPTKQATATPVIAAGRITGAIITDPGWGYVAGPAVTFSSPPAGTPAEAEAVVSGGAVTGFVITQVGSGYSEAPAVTLGSHHSAASATASLNISLNVRSITVTAPGAGYFTAPTVTLSAPDLHALLGGEQATAEATIANGIITGITVLNDGFGYASPPTVTISDPPPGTQATAEAQLTGGVVTGVTITDPGSGYMTTPGVYFSEPPAVPSTPTGRSVPLRMLLHVDDSGNARVLSQVFLGKLAAPPHLTGIATRESALKQDEKSSAMRIVATHLPLDRVLTTGSGSVTPGQTLVRTVTIPFNDPTNPFVHGYHPDHDNKSARGEALGAGVESYNIVRTLNFRFTATPPSGSTSTGWGSSTIGGFYSEVLQGLHKNPIQTAGTFELRRASEDGSITTN